MTGGRAADDAARAGIGASHRIAVHRGDGKGRLVACGAGIGGERAPGGLLQRDAFAFQGMKRRNDTFARFVDRYHLNMSSTRTLAARASFSATSAEKPRERPVRKPRISPLATPACFAQTVGRRRREVMKARKVSRC